MKRVKGRVLAKLMLLSMVLSLFTGQFIKPVYASSGINTDVTPSLTHPGDSPAYSFTTTVSQGSAIPTSITVEIPSGYTKHVPDSSVKMGTITAAYKGTTATGDIYNNKSVQLTSTYDYTVSWVNSSLTVSTSSNLPATAETDLVITVNLNSGYITTDANAPLGPRTWVVKDQGGNTLETVTTSVIANASVTPSQTHRGDSPAYSFTTTIPQYSNIPTSINIAIPAGYTKQVPDSSVKMGTITATYKGTTATGDIYNNKSVQLTSNYDYTVAWGTNSLTITTSSNLPATAETNLVISVSLNSGYITTDSSATLGTKVWTVTDESNNTLAQVSTSVVAVSGGGGTTTPPPATTPPPVDTTTDDQTNYNNSQLEQLDNVTTEQQQQAALPQSKSTYDPTAEAPQTFETQDGVLAIELPPAALPAEQNAAPAPVKLEVKIGAVKEAPKAEKQAVMLNPLKFQREFGIVPIEPTGGTQPGTTPAAPAMLAAPARAAFKVADTDVPEGVSPKNLAVYYWDTTRTAGTASTQAFRIMAVTSGDWVKIGGVYDPVTKSINAPIYKMGTYAVMADTSTPAKRLSGYSQIDTAIAVSKDGWKAGAENVILANAYQFPDAMAAAPLAFKLNAPILLTDNKELSSQTLTEIKRLAPEKVYIVGGTAVVSQKIEDDLKALYGADNVVRYYGLTKYDTSAAIAKALGIKGKAIVVNGNVYQDALSISSYAAYNGIPILYTAANAMPTATSNTLADLSVKNTYVAGGTAVVSNAVYDELPGATRYAGLTAADTAKAVAEGLNLNANRVYVVTSRRFPDALVAGNLAAHTMSPVLLVDKDVPASTLSFVENKKADISSMTVIGGTAAVSPEQDDVLRAAME